MYLKHFILHIIITTMCLVSLVSAFMTPKLLSTDSWTFLWPKQLNKNHSQTHEASKQIRASVSRFSSGRASSLPHPTQLNNLNNSLTQQHVAWEGYRKFSQIKFMTNICQKQASPHNWALSVISPTLTCCSSSSSQACLDHELMHMLMIIFQPIVWSFSSAYIWLAEHPMLGQEMEMASFIMVCSFPSDKIHHTNCCEVM